MLSQSQEPSVANLISVGGMSTDLLDKHASLINEGVRNELKHAHDMWDDIAAHDAHLAKYYRKEADKPCCITDEDFQALEW